jgi:hypothetical protein
VRGEKERKKEKKEKRVSLLFRDAPSSSGEMMTTENRREWLLTAAAMSIHTHTHNSFLLYACYISARPAGKRPFIEWKLFHRFFLILPCICIYIFRGGEIGRDQLLNIIDPSFFVEGGGEGENKGKSHDGSYDNRRDRTQDTSYHPKWLDLPITIRCAPRQLYSYSFFSYFDFSPFRRKTVPNYLQLTIEKILSGDMNFLFLFKVPQFS